ncbi:hypothetical protein SCUCBS95973_008389 [Sporothrix curviconia]|uniref:Uncharacterized protein n=1 Tax=Sporothrix curviconia TaxID=1260050 RepID=A0ABP0CL60_9PEZI
MISVTSPADARVLIIGNDDLTEAVIQNFKSYGIQDITLMNSEGPRPGVDTNQFVQKDALEYIAEDVHYFQSFSLVVVLNQLRALEVALSDARWPIKDGGSSKFVSLHMDLLPWTDAKRALIKQEFPAGKQNSQFHAYLSAGRAVAEFKKSEGSWPIEADAGQVRASLTGVSNDKALAFEFVDQICEGGFGSVPETIALMGRLISTDGLKLLTGSGHPINNANVEEVIAIATE